jgi:uncharacterized protein (DUF2164 family)
MKELKLDKEARSLLTSQIRNYLDEELEIEVGNMDVEFLVDFLSGSLGAHYYNLGLKDAQALFARKADDITDEIYAMERKVEDRR